MQGTRAAIYVRVSDPGATDKYGMDTQEAECRAYAVQRGWDVTTVYREFHSGADLFERPRMTALREAMRRREFDVLLVHRLDRLARDVNHQGYILSEAEHVGVVWESATEDLSDPMMGGILRAVIGAFAEMDRMKITANTTRGRRAKAEQGRPLGQGKPRYGLAWADDAKSRCVEDPATIPHLHRIFRDYARGLSLRALGVALEADGILPPYHARTGSTRWGASTLRDILSDRTYIGEGEAFRTVSTRERNGDGTKTRRHRPRPAGDRIALPAGTFPAVIDHATFARVLDRLASNKRESCRRDRDPQVGILRRGYAVCGGCGHPLTVVAGREQAYYRCHTDGKRLWGCPETGAIPVADLDAAIWDWLSVELADEHRVRWHLDQTRAPDAAADDLATVERHLKAIAAQQANLADAVARLDGNADALAPLVEKLDALGRQRRAAERDHSDIIARQSQQALAAAQVRDLADHCRTIAAQMAHVTAYADRRAMLDILGVRVTLYPAARQPRWTATSVITPEGTNSEKVSSACRSAAATGRGRRG